MDPQRDGFLELWQELGFNIFGLKQHETHEGTDWVGGVVCP